MAEIVIGIDIGTSGVRAAAVEANNSLISYATAAIRAPITDGLRKMQDPVLWWDALGRALDGLHLTGHTARAIAIDGTSGTILPIAADGTPVGLASMYNDVAEPADVAMVASAAPQETAALGATSPLARALAMRNGATRIIHQADWLMGKLCGRFDVSDENNALKSGYDPVARMWPQWIGKTGFDVALFPAVVPAGTRIGTILPEIARRFHLPADTAIVTGTTDGCAAFLASGAAAPGDGVTSLGTTLTVKLLSASPVFAPQYGIYSHRIGDQWLAGGASNVGGVTISKHFSKAEIERLSPLIDADHPTGLDYYPLPAPGERFPINDPSYAPRLTPRPANDRVYFQAILEGIASVEALGYRRLAELGATPLASIRTAGGGAANDGWTKIRLKKLGVPARPSLSEHAAVGTARLAWRGIGHAN